MSTTSIKAAITQALATPKGHAQVSKAEAQAITQAALKETSGAPRVTADETKLLGQLLNGDSFDGGKTAYTLTAPARQVLEAFAAAQHLPIGANAAVVRSSIEATLSTTALGAPLSRPPSTSGTFALTLSDNRPSDGALREALLNPQTGKFYLKTTSQGRGQPQPVVNYFGPFALGAATPTPPAGGLSAADLGTKVAAAAGDYLFPSETDVALSYLVGPKNTPVTAASVAAAFGAQADAARADMFHTSDASLMANKFPEEISAADFLARYSQASDPNDPASMANAAKFKGVADLLKGNLTDLHVYRFDEHDPADRNRSAGEVTIFIAGHTAAGDLVSVMTGAVET
jgi:hypothetical protein